MSIGRIAPGPHAAWGNDAPATDRRFLGSAILLLLLLLSALPIEGAVSPHTSTAPARPISLGPAIGTAHSSLLDSESAADRRDQPAAPAAAVDYQIILNASGLPPVTNWTSTLTNVTSGASTTVTNNHTAHVYRVPNGTYTYKVSASLADYAASQPSGTVVVNGTGFTVRLYFRFVYRVTFDRTGIPDGTDWQVTIRNASGKPTTTTTTQNSTVFSQPNGTYSFAATDFSATYQVVNPTGNFSVNGSALNRTIVFAQLFRVLIYETGLPPASTWSVGVGNSTSNVTGTTLTGLLVFLEPNGTYWVRGASSLSNYVPANASRELVINGTSITLTVPFVQKNPPGGGVPFKVWFPIAVGGTVAAVAAIVAVALVLRRRRQRNRPGDLSDQLAGQAGAPVTPATQAPEVQRPNPP